MDLEGVARWVREAERERDAACAGTDAFDRVARERWQKEVYRRRRVLYELKGRPPAAVRPEMILVLYDPEDETYRCKIFYKEPRPPRVIEGIDVGARSEDILELKTHPDPGVRLAAGKVEVFHALRARVAGEGRYVPSRRVFYADEL